MPWSGTASSSIGVIADGCSAKARDAISALAAGTRSHAALVAREVLTAALMDRLTHSVMPGPRRAWSGLPHLGQ